MQERTYKPDGAEHSVTIGKTTFIVSSFTDTQATATSEELIIRMLKSKVAEAAKEEKSEILFIPAVSLRHDRDLFLDDYSLEQLKEEIGCPVYAIENGLPLLDTIEEICNGR